jgi:hypothetical protein
VPEAVRTTTSHSGAAKCRQRRQPVDAGHGEVEQDEVGQQPARGGDRLGAVRGLGDDGEAVLLEQRREGAAGQRMVVDDQDALGHRRAYRQRRPCR